MKRLWICVAFLAIQGNLAFADDSDEENNLYDYDSYEYPDRTTKNNYENRYLEDLPGHIKFRSTESDKLYDIQDYQFEDNRSELEEIFNNAAEDTHFNSEKSTRNELGYKTTTTLDNLDTVVNNKNFVSKIFEDTKSILNDEKENGFSQDDVVELYTEKTSTLSEILEETSRILGETFDTMEENNENSDEESLNYSYVSLESKENVHKKQETTEEDSVDQAIADYRADLERMRNTMRELTDIDDNIFDFNDGNNTLVKNISSSEEYKDIGDKKADNKDENENIDRIVEVFSNRKTNMSHPILYLDDALPATQSEITTLGRDMSTPKLNAQETILRDQPSDRNSLISEPISSTTAEVTHTTPSIEDLPSSEFNNLMQNFRSQNRISEITHNDIRSANYVWLTVDNPIIITSQNYPSPYPTSSVTDWMITGDGVGIELNITDFAINGHVGDYVLFKPGGIDESGSSGLLFSYTLSKERRYRFLDVDKMFVRFEARPGPQVLRGFSFSVRMVVPRPGAPQPEPEPEPEVIVPSETITLNLGGLTLESFLHVEEQFRHIVAQMAATYIIDNNIDPGVNTTLEMTQITSRALCFHNWPKFERCVEVRFGVPLVYEDDGDEEREPRLNAVDLANMWETYSHIDPYAERLSSLGITEYQVPNDRGILTVWLVIAGGVVISMAMLAFTLWRFSCFENYTRMPAFSDTDSIKEKRNLDLYPTPHQTLPPLYSETDYKWADADSTKVDVRGYTNKSYMREDPYDLESDEDIVPVSARNTSFSPRDIYSV